MSVGASVARGSVPVVDCSALASAEVGRRRATAEQIGSAFERFGFLVVSGHGVAADVIAAMRAVTLEFFALPLAEKLAAARPVSLHQHRGYRASETHAVRADAPPDLVENFVMSRFDSEADARRGGWVPGMAGEEFFALNVWPARPPQMRDVWHAYYDALAELAARLMRACALALALPERWFDDKFDQHFSSLLANYYPPQPRAPRPGQLRIGEHTDYGSLTIIHQERDQGGLEIRDPASGAWVAVPCIADTFVVNIGDLMGQWTNDRWVSTLHRVANPARHAAHEPRLSIPFFYQPSFHAEVACIPTCTSADNPARYPATTSGEWAIAVTRPAGT